jgi:hypothetical protein
VGKVVTQGELRPDVEAIRRYGEAHPEEFVQVWFEGVRLVALFAGSEEDVAAHEAALRAIVGFPDQLEVRRSPRTRRALAEIREEITSSYAGAWHGLGEGKGVVHVRLWADQLEAAEALHRRYGDAVELEVGRFPYPDRFAAGRHPAVSPDPPDHPQPQPHPPLPEGVVLALPEDFTVRSAGTGRTVLTVRNDTATDVRSSSNGTLFPPIVDPVTGEVVGGYEGAMTAQLKVVTVAPGTSADLPVLVGTASSRPELGWAVPPGRWALRFRLQVGDGSAETMVPNGRHAGDVLGVRLLPFDVT